MEWYGAENILIGVGATVGVALLAALVLGVFRLGNVLGRRAPEQPQAQEEVTPPERAAAVAQAERTLGAMQRRSAAEEMVEVAELDVDTAILKRIARAYRVQSMKLRMEELQHLPNPNVLEVLQREFGEEVRALGAGPAGQPVGQTFFRLTINGQAVTGDRVDVQGGYVTVDPPVPGAQGYAQGTRITLIAHPTDQNARVRWGRASWRNQPPGQAIVTMDRNRDVVVTITPAVGTTGGVALRTPPPIP